MPFESSMSCRTKPNCSLCPAASACVSGGAPKEEASRWTSAVEPHAPVFPDAAPLFSAGEAADVVYVVRAGCIKTYAVDEDGNERVRGFHLPGDVVGLDALGAKTYPCNASAVVPSQVCAVPRSRVTEMMATSPSIMRRLLERASQNLSFALALSGDYSADERVAAFLLHMQQRLSARPGEKDCVRLPMTRREMGSYLRLATETVCRVLARLEQKGVLELEDKAIRLNARALRQMASAVSIDFDALAEAA